MANKLGIVILLLGLSYHGDCDIGNGIPEAQSLFSFPQLGSAADPADLLNKGEGKEITAKIWDLVCTTRWTLYNMMDIAVEDTKDNPEIGASIGETLQGEIDGAYQIFRDFVRDSTRSRITFVSRRFRRGVKEDGAAAMEKVGDKLVGAMGKIAGDADKLSPGAKKKLKKKYKEGIDKCQADSCKAAAKVLAAAEDADDERQ